MADPLPIDLHTHRDITFHNFKKMPLCQNFNKNVASLKYNFFKDLRTSSPFDANCCGRYYFLYRPGCFGWLSLVTRFYLEVRSFKIFLFLPLLPASQHSKCLFLGEFKKTIPLRKNGCSHYGYNENIFGGGYRQHAP